jgi:tetratricopeptide (TPR) repeat protein
LYYIIEMKKFGILFLALGLVATAGAGAAETDFFRKGLSYYQNGEFQLASALLEEAKRVDSRNPLVYFYLGNVYYQLKDLDKSIVSFTTGLDLADQKGPFFYNLGNCYFLKGNYDFSAEMYAKAIASDPTLYDSHLNAGNAYYKKGNFAGTIIQWETYLAKYPETPQYANIEKAIAYLKEELLKQSAGGAGTGADAAALSSQNHLLDEVMSDLDSLLNRTENVMEMSEKPIDDLTKEDIER